MCDNDGYNDGHDYPQEQWRRWPQHVFGVDDDDKDNDDDDDLHWPVTLLMAYV